MTGLHVSRQHLLLCCTRTSDKYRYDIAAAGVMVSKDIHRTYIRSCKLFTGAYSLCVNRSKAFCSLGKLIT